MSLSAPNILPISFGSNPIPVILLDEKFVLADCTVVELLAAIFSKS